MYNLQIFLFIYTVILQVEFYPTFLVMSVIKYLHSFLNEFKCFAYLLFFIAAIIIVEWLTVSIKINQCNWISWMFFVVIRIFFVERYNRCKPTEPSKFKTFLIILRNTFYEMSLLPRHANPWVSRFHDNHHSIPQKVLVLVLKNEKKLFKIKVFYDSYTSLFLCQK